MKIFFLLEESLANNPSAIRCSFTSFDIYLSIDIWQRIKNTSLYHSIQLKESSQIELRECQKVIDFTRYVISSEFGRKTTFSYIRRTTTGYTTHLLCSNNNVCDARWYFRISLVDNKVNITCNKLCEHLLNNPGEWKSNWLKLIFIFWFKIGIYSVKCFTFNRKSWNRLQSVETAEHWRVDKLQKQFKPSSYTDAQTFGSAVQRAEYDNRCAWWTIGKHWPENKSHSQC